MIEESILNILALRLLSSCSGSMRSLVLKTTVSFAVHADTGRIILTLETRLEKIALRLAKRSQALLNRLRRLAGDNCEVIVVHNIAPTGEPTYKKVARKPCGFSPGMKGASRLKPTVNSSIGWV